MEGTMGVAVWGWEKERGGLSPGPGSKELSAPPGSLEKKQWGEMNRGFQVVTNMRTPLMVNEGF